jgi:hypothetical protein
MNSRLCSISQIPQLGPAWLKEKPRRGLRAFRKSRTGARVVMLAPPLTYLPKLSSGISLLARFK